MQNIKTNLGPNIKKNIKKPYFGPFWPESLKTRFLPLPTKKISSTPKHLIFGPLSSFWHKNPQKKIFYSKNVALSRILCFMFDPILTLHKKSENFYEPFFLENEWKIFRNIFVSWLNKI